MRTSTKLAFACLTALYGSSLHAADQTASGPIGVPQDWSSRNIIHRQPKTPDEFEAAGRTREMAAAYRDPRYVASLLRRVEAEGRRATTPTAPRAVKGQVSQARNPHDDRHRPRTPGGTEDGMPRDWSNVLGGGVNGQGGYGLEGVFPAKYNFDITATPSCDDDFVVYTTNAAGANGSGTSETWSGTVGGSFGSGNTITIGAAGARRVVLTARNSNNTGLNFRTGGQTDSERATNLSNAINRYRSQTGFSAKVESGTSVVITSNTRGNVTDGLVSETLDKFSLTRTNGTGAPGQPTLIAFNQLYQGSCNGTWNEGGTTKAPNVLWSYNTGTGYITETSPVLSYLDDGQQVAFMQRSGNSLQLVLLKPLAGQGTAAEPATPTLVTNAAYRGSAAGSYTVINFSTAAGANNNNSGGAVWSSPFVDYTNDTLWAGDGNGILHKFTGVFQGTPAEVTSGGFPAVVQAGMKLSPPVASNGNVYIGSQSGSGTVGGRLHRVDAANGTVYSSAKLAVADSTGIREAVIMDNGTGSVFAFLFNDGTTGNNLDCSAAEPGAGNFDACRVVARFGSGFADGAAPLQRVYVGRGNSRVSTLYAGGFDDAYYSSVDGDGAMYIVGGRPDTTYFPTLWKIPLTNGAMGAPVRGPEVGDNVTACASQPNCSNGVYNISPVNVVKNPVTNVERLFFSMAKDGTAAGCTGACVYMYDLSQTWGPSMVATAGFPVTGGTGGLVIDNVRASAEPGMSQLYFAQQDTAVRERWQLTISGDISSGSVTVNGVSFTPGASTSCTGSGGTFNVSGDFKSDSSALKACLLQADLPGFQIVGEHGSSSSTVIVVASNKGNQTDTLVTESLDNTTRTITQGTASTAGNAVQVSQSALD